MQPYFNLIIEYGSQRDVPFISINGNNLLYMLTITGMPDFIRSIRDLVGLYLIVSTLIYIIMSIHKLVDGEFE